MASICVFCASSEAIDARWVELGAAVGTELAARGHRLVSGGGSISTMGALARAARAGGAHTTGVIPRSLVDREVADHDADELLVTPDMRTRKGQMDARSDAFLVLPGGIGTLEELLEIWVARVLGMHNRPVVVLDPAGLYAPLREQIRVLVEQRFMRPAAAERLVWTSTVPAALDAIEAELVLPTTAEPDAAEVAEP
ncbi:MAG TPA: TIGR00730 family Rossman fold protein [Sporichthyaceae bacterium]|nr:TIGR00730 family Rossman fold protein [Sporichthyaceae bacterium]